MDATTGPKRRSRNGCWTCRKRKKKCDATGNPCQNCTRLKLHCENEVRLVWEDDFRRPGMRRRGPSAADKRKDSVSGIQSGISAMRPESSNGRESSVLSKFTGVLQGTVQKGWQTSPQNHPLVLQQSLTLFPRPMNEIESAFLEHYVSRFSRTYPTCSSSGNPFLTVLMPLAMRSTVVLDSVLALSGATRWRNGQTQLVGDALRFRQRALKGCMSLIGEVGHVAEARDRKATSPPILAGNEKLLHLLASSVLFLLYEKVTGDNTWLPHFTFINELFDQSLQPILAENMFSSDVIEAVGFLHQLFLYNDLVRSTSTHTAPLSNFYLADNSTSDSPTTSTEGAVSSSISDRYCFPNLISRISSGDHTVKEADIEAWRGNMNWLPSFALDSKDPKDRTDSDLAILSNLYRTTAKVYRLRVFIDRRLPIETAEDTDNAVQLSRLACLAANQLILLPEGSAYETALLWPIGIAAKELAQHQQDERDMVIYRLQSMESRFHMRHFRRAQDFFHAHWYAKDNGDVGVQRGNVSSPMSLLLG